MMLGSRRTTVTLIAGVLQKRGLIKYQRGRVKILDRAALEAASCDCYQITKELYAGLYCHPVMTAEAPAETLVGAEKAPGNGAGGASAEKDFVGGLKSKDGSGGAGKKGSKA